MLTMKMTFLLLQTKDQWELALLELTTMMQNLKKPSGRGEKKLKKGNQLFLAHYAMMNSREMKLMPMLQLVDWMVQLPRSSIWKRRTSWRRTSRRRKEKVSLEVTASLSVTNVGNPISDWRALTHTNVKAKRSLFRFRNLQNDVKWVSFFNLDIRVISSKIKSNS